MKKMLHKNKVSVRGRMYDDIKPPLPKHSKQVPILRAYFHLDDSFQIYKDYQLYSSNVRGNWIVMKDRQACFSIYEAFAKEICRTYNKGTNNEEDIPKD